MSEAWRLPAHASLFGKLPTVLDYVRINHSYPPAIALDEWMSRALSDLTVANLSWPSARFRFLFAPGGCEHALLGVFGPSRDRAGRKFPLSVFAPVPVAAVARKFSALPRAEQFFAAAESLLDAAPGLSREDAAERLLELPTLAPDLLDTLHDDLQLALDERSHQNLVQELYAGVAHEAEDALTRAASTFAKHRGAAPERALTLDCPVASSEDVCAWTSLAEVCLAWSVDAPSLFWTSQPAAPASEHKPEPGRLLVSLGTPLPALPLWLADKKRKNERLISLHPLTAAGGPGYGYASHSSATGPATPIWTPPPEEPAPSASAPTPVQAHPVHDDARAHAGFEASEPSLDADATVSAAHDSRDSLIPARAAAREVSLWRKLRALAASG